MISSARDQSPTKAKIQPTRLFEKVLTNSKSKVLLLLFRYLEGNYLIGPSLDIFKMAMLNKKLNRLVLQLYGVATFRDFACLFARQ